MTRKYMSADALRAADSRVGRFVRAAALLIAAVVGISVIYLCLMPALAENAGDPKYIYFDNGLAGYDRVLYSTDGGNTWNDMALMSQLDSSDERMDISFDHVNTDYTYVTASAVAPGTDIMFRGYDSRISWGYESSIQFYKRLLSDLIECEQGFPSFDLSKICPEEWKPVEEKWKPRLLKGAKFTDCYAKDKVFRKGFEVEDFEKDVFKCWMIYLNHVLFYFMEADPNTCSLTPEYEALLDQVKLPFDKAERKIVEHNGVFVSQYPSKPFTPEEEARHKRMGEIDQYQTDMLMKGMAEVAKNILVLND